MLASRQPINVRVARDEQLFVYAGNVKLPLVIQKERMKSTYPTTGPLETTTMTRLI